LPLLRRRGGASDDVGEGGHPELDGAGSAPEHGVNLRELVVGAGQADLQSLDFSGPGFAFGFGDAVVEVATDLLQPGALRWVWPQERAPDTSLTEMILSWNASLP
jgi:hypothetical protein